jgi:hypothetical protein
MILRFLLSVLVLACWPAWVAAAQALHIGVLDSRQHPVPGIALTITPLAGSLLTISGPSDRRGQILVSWEPEYRELNADSADKLADYSTALRWEIRVPEFMPESGQIERREVSRSMNSPQLAALDVGPSFTPIYQSIMLHKPKELWGAGLAEAPEGLRRWCRAFYDENFLTLRALGTELAWPAFEFNDKTLTIYAQYKDYGWAGAAESSLLARAALNSYLPWCILLSEQLEGLSPVSTINLIFTSNLPSRAADPHSPAPPVRLRASLPVVSLALATAGGRTPDDLVCFYPLALID